MINTLRITSVLAAGLAIALISFSAVYGFKSDPEIDQLLKTPTILEEFKATKGVRHEQPDARKSPLVIQAKAFADHLDPPPAPRAIGPSKPVSRGTTRPVTPPPVSAKFNVLSICHCAADPNLSLALIQEAGADSRWIRRQDQVGHQSVVSIEEAAVVLDDGQRVPIEERPKMSLVVREGEEANVAARPVSVIRPGTTRSSRITRPGTSRYKPPRPLAHRPLPSAARRTHTTEPKQPKRPVPSPMDEEDTQEMQRVIDQLRELNRKSGGGELSESDEQKRKEIMERLTSRMRAQRLSRQETRSLDTIGQRLDPNGAGRDIHIGD